MANRVGTTHGHSTSLGGITVRQDIGNSGQEMGWGRYCQGQKIYGQGEERDTSGWAREGKGKARMGQQWGWSRRRISQNKGLIWQEIFLIEEKEGPQYFLNLKYQ